MNAKDCSATPCRNNASTVTGRPDTKENASNSAKRERGRGRDMPTTGLQRVCVPGHSIPAPMCWTCRRDHGDLWKPDWFVAALNRRLCGAACRAPDDGQVSKATWQFRAAKRSTAPLLRDRSSHGQCGATACIREEGPGDLRRFRDQARQTRRLPRQPMRNGKLLDDAMQRCLAGGNNLVPCNGSAGSLVRALLRRWSVRVDTPSGIRNRCRSRRSSRRYDLRIRLAT